MKQEAPSISIFFPTYNEEANIRESVERMRSSVSSLTDTYEIIIVNDGSHDKTAIVAKRLHEEDPVHVRVVTHTVNRGYGAALISGIDASRYDWIFFTDADLQFDPDELSLLAHYIRKYKVIIGYRAKRKDPFMRLVNARGWNILNRLFFGLKAKDIDCAFKLFHRDTLSDLPLRSRGAMLSAEILIRLSRRGVVWKEIPVTHLPRKQGSPTGAKLSVIWKALKEMWMLYKGDLGNKSVLEFLRFGIVGVINTTLDIGLYFILTRIVFGGDILMAKGLSYFAGTIFSFIANRYWTFSKYSTIRLLEVGKFYITVLVAVAVNVGLMYVFTEIIGLYDAVAILPTTLVTIAWNFLSMKFWVYSKSSIEILEKQSNLKRDSDYIKQ